jgi:outer membrane protein insertion porin family
MRFASRLAILFLALVVSRPARAEEGAFIRTLQVRSSGRPVQLETHAGQLLDRARLQADVRRLWATGHFDDIRVEAEETPDGVDLVITLVEKPRLYLRRAVFEPERERRRLNLRPGDPLDAALGRRAAAVLRRELAADGYADAEVDAELVPTGFQEADLVLRVEPGPRFSVGDVRFAGELGLRQEELQGALEATRGRRLLAWKLRPPFSREGVEADLERLRSLYLARGYFDARVALAGVEFTKQQATVTFAVEPGPQYRVRRVELEGAEAGEELSPDFAGALPRRALCRSLLAARRRTEKEGAVDFAARLEVVPADPPRWGGLVTEDTENWVALTARVEAGAPHTVGRVEFRGHHHFSDLTLRRAWTLQEGDAFDLGELRRSLARINQLGFFEPVSEDGVTAARDAERRRIDLTVWLKEIPRGRYGLSGPLLPGGLAGPLQFSVALRLPAWGRGPLELSTYYGSLSLMAFSLPAAGVFALAPEARWLPLVALERPLLAGQRWQSGFLLAPQLGWQGTLTSYGLTQARQAAAEALAADQAEAAPLAVPISWRGEAAEPPPVGYLHCEAPRPRLAWLRAAGTLALDLLLARAPL